MATQSLITRRHVLLVLDDEAACVAAMVNRGRSEQPMAADVVVCRSAEEVRVRLGSGRRYSAVMASLDHPEIDTDLLDAAARAATPVIVLGGRGRAPGRASGPVDTGSPAALALARTIGMSSAPVMLADRPPDLAPFPQFDSGPDRRARLVALCGARGAGTSTVAAALAAGVAATGGVDGTDLLLGDFALHSDQALLNGLPLHAGLPSAPVGLLDLIRSFRRHRGARHQMTASDLRAHTVEVRGFRLLPGLLRPAHWTAVSPTAFDLALSALRSAFDLVIADVTAEFEGERQVGSVDVEERNHMARQVVTVADVVLVIGRPGRSGLRWLSGVVHDLLDLGIDPARIQPVLNRVARSSGRPADGRLSAVPAAVVSLPEQVLDDGAPVPAELAEPVRAVTLALLAYLPPPAREPAPVRVRPGSLGTWTGSEPA